MVGFAGVEIQPQDTQHGKYMTISFGTEQHDPLCSFGSFKQVEVQISSSTAISVRFFSFLYLAKLEKSFVII